MGVNETNVTTRCPVVHGANTSAGASPVGWLPKALNLDIIHQNDANADPFGRQFSYLEELKKLDVSALKKDRHALTIDSQAWWSADWGITESSSFAGPGARRVPIAREMAEAVPAAAISVMNGNELPRLTASNCAQDFTPERRMV
jgi:hypothetical protein